MKPAAFKYSVPSSVEEALEHLQEHGDDARVLAGGQSLVRLMNHRMETPGVIIDINRLPGLDLLDVDDGGVRVGALVRQRASETSPLVRQHAAVFAEAGGHVAHASVRERGTVVGSLAFADPCAELPTALVALDGEILVRSARGQRLIPAAEFFIGPFQSAIQSDELALEARLPSFDRPRSGSAFVELTRRHGELPVCAVASIVVLDGQGNVEEARIAVGAVGDHPVRATEAEGILTGSAADEEAVREAAARVCNELDPMSSVHASADYRRHVTSVMTRRSVAMAIARAAEGVPRD